MSRWALLLFLLAAAAPERVYIARFPWHVTVEEIADYHYHECSGSIISRTWVLTVAFCTRNKIPEQLIVKAGSSFHEFGGKRYGVANIIRHEDYDEVTQDNDIALLQTSKRISFGIRVKAVNLGSTELAVGTEVTTTGWGHRQDILRADTEFVVDRDYCQAAFESHRRVVPESLICADKDKDPMDCTDHDIGGALVVGNTQYAVRVDGCGCSRPPVPGLYTSIPALRSWITDKTGI